MADPAPPTLPVYWCSLPGAPSADDANCPGVIDPSGGRPPRAGQIPTSEQGE